MRLTFITKRRLNFSANGASRVTSVVPCRRFDCEACRREYNKIFA